MKYVRWIGLAATLASLSLANAGEVIGRALIVEGVAQVHRDARDMPLVTGGKLESGDLVKVGDTSSVQILFSDNTLAAVRSNTEFLIQDFRYSASGDADSSVFKLVRGGLRTITGLIGKRKPDNFHLITPTATIGIRGTNLSALVCNGDCLNADGTKAPDGVYGGVTEGRIAVSNSQGEIELAKDEYFYAPDSNTKPNRLIGPPDFLRDKLAGRARTEQKQVALASPRTTPGSAPATVTPAPDTSSATGGNTSTDTSSATAASSSTSESAAAGTATGTSTGASTVSATTDSSLEATTTPAPTAVGTPSVSTATAQSTAPTYTPASTPTVQQGTAPINFSESYSILIAHTGIFTGTQPCSSSCGTGYFSNSTSLPVQTFTFTNVLYPQGTDPAYIAMQTQPDLNYRENATQYTVSVALDSGTTMPGTLSLMKSASTQVASVMTSDGLVTWGVYFLNLTQSGSTVDNNYVETTYEHWLQGPPVTSLPTSGVFTYAAVGGTRPTDQSGNLGTVTNGGSWTVNFGTNTIASASPVTWTMPSGTSYAVNVTTPQPFSVTVTPYATGPGPAGGTVGSGGTQIATLDVSNFTSCNGNSCSIIFSRLAPLLAPHHMATSISTLASVSGGQEVTGQIRVYSR